MRAYFKFIVWTVGILGALAGFLYVAFFDVWVIPGDDPNLTRAILPTLRTGDVVLAYRHSHPGWGNLVRCPDPDAPGRWVVGRIGGVAGDRLEIRNDSITVNDRAETTVGACDPPKMTVKSPTSNEDVELSCSRREFAGLETATLRSNTGVDAPFSTVVDPGRIFLVSDDLHFHLDSRDFGQLSPEGCQHIVYRLYGATGFGDSERRLTILW